MTRLTTLLLVAAMLLAGLGPDAALAAKRNPARKTKPVTPADLVLPVDEASLATTQDWYVVLLRASAGDPGRVAQRLAKADGLTVKNVYRKALDGFAAKVPADRLAALRSDPAVVSVEQDRPITLIDPERAPSAAKKKPSFDFGPYQSVSNNGKQVVPWGVARTGAPENPLWQDAANHPIDIGIAVIDTGVDKDHPDLNVAGGFNCSSTNAKDENDFHDGYGHGTHVSGTAAAKNNAVGVVGVAPGARLYGVKVLNDKGIGSTSTLLCGLDWVAQQVAADVDISVVNMSLGGPGNPNAVKGCDAATAASEEHALCDLVAAGVTVVAAAGNECRDAADYDPAMYPEVITVGALADDDGKPGGLGGPTQVSRGCGKKAPYVNVPDDTMAPFSNYGPAVDVWAPGEGILSTVSPNGTKNPSLYDGVGWSGTSMATPHVTGSVALWVAGYRAVNGGADPTVEQVRSALLTAGSAGHPGAESLTLVNSRYGQRGSLDMPQQVQALVINNDPNGPSASAAPSAAAKAAPSKHGKGRGKGTAKSAAADPTATPAADGANAAPPDATTPKPAKSGKHAKAHKAKGKQQKRGK